MPRTFTKNRLPDMVNCTMPNHFTMMPNDLIRNNQMSAKAKCVLFILLSNDSGWTTYRETLAKYMKEGKSVIDSAIKELKTFGYVKIIKYRETSTKQLKGSVWMYTNLPNNFDYENIEKQLQTHCFEPVYRDTDFPDVGNPALGKPTSGKSNTKNTNIKNTNIKNTKIYSARENFSTIEEEILPKEIKEKNIIPPTLKMVTKYCTKRNNSIDAEKFIDHYKARGWKLGKEKMKDWQAAVRTWEKNDKQYSSNKTTSNKTGSRSFGIKSDYREPDYTY